MTARCCHLIPSDNYHTREMLSNVAREKRLPLSGLVDGLLVRYERPDAFIKAKQKICYYPLKDNRQVNDSQG